MAKNERRFVCQSCGAVHSRWAGRCDSCGEWNTLQEEASAFRPGAAKKGRKIALAPLTGAEKPPPRLKTGLGELDRALGGGLARGSAILIGGDPGVGKSTLCLQAAAALSRRGRPVVYVSGEESLDQVRLRAERLGLDGAPLEVAASIETSDVIATLEAVPDLALLVIDSIQTMRAQGFEQAPGSLSQIRASADELIRFAKRSGAAVMLVGHVTKDGQIAGPKVLEHMVDTVLYFESERARPFRILRAVKNRFGAANEIGVFEMRDQGLEPVLDPSASFLGERGEGVSGVAVFCGIEGTRPLLVEVQALLAGAAYGAPRRAVVGWDAARLAMLVAVLESRCGLSFAQKDIYLNMAGGLKVGEPAADLAVAAALISAARDRPLDPLAAYFGEIGLGGEVRAVSQADARVEEARKLGFERVYRPKRSGGSAKTSVREIVVESAAFLLED